MRIVLATFFLVNAFAAPAMARVFTLSKERFASYLVGSYGLSNLKNTPYYGESSSAYSYTTEYPNLLGGEFGFIYFNGRLGWRFGFDSIKPLKVEGQARDGSGTNLYTYLNEVTVLTPKIGLDLNLYANSYYRVSINGFFGTAALTSKTDYSAVTIAPNAAHSVDERSSAPCYGGGVTQEISFFDTTTFVLEIGYRQLKFTNVKYAADVTTFSGAVSKGDEVRNADGSAHEIDFTGAYASAGLRVYLF
jgi:hypothetical protein